MKSQQSHRKEKISRILAILKTLPDDVIKQLLDQWETELVANAKQTLQIDVDTNDSLQGDSDENPSQ